ncbi:LPS assembly lipoprotein LptE [Comamonas sp. GB3 AK4-5]|uniref:LPS-assembly lipoprotein LptE n=1 Tax=Comamonas sp. GB3 AK4-5 TaxID=3231487 RepID=UPI00351F4497
MRKRTLLSLMALAPVVSACGFRIRGVPDFPFSSIYLNAAPSSTFARDLQRNLATASDRLRVLRAPAKPEDAQVIWQLLGERRERIIVSKNAAGQVRDLQLRYRMTFRLYSPDGLEWTPPTELEQERDMSYDETLALAKDQEAEMIYQTMQSDLVQQVIRRLASAQPPKAE